jgi:dihydroneopterin aldolase
MSEDRIIISEVEFWGHGGVSKAERELPQRYRVDIEIFYDLHPAGHSDNLADTVSYSQVYKAVKEFGEKSRFQLLETLAEGIAHTVLERFPAEKVRIRLKKMAPPIPGPLDYVAVEIERSRSSPGMRQ